MLDGVFFTLIRDLRILLDFRKRIEINLKKYVEITYNVNLFRSVLMPDHD